MIENLQRAWQGEGPEFEPLPDRRRRRREHLGTGVRAILIVLLALIGLRAAFDLAPGVHQWWRLRALARQLVGQADPQNEAGDSASPHAKEQDQKENPPDP